MASLHEHHNDQQQQPKQGRTWSLKEQYERALRRADKNGLVVRGQRYRKSDSMTVRAVPSQCNPNHWHLVVLEGGQRFLCDCEAQQNDRYCVHKALARRRYLLEVQAIRKWEADQAAFAEQRRVERMVRDLEREHTAQPEGQA